MAKVGAIVICSSAVFFRECIEIAGKLEKLGYKVLLPDVALAMKKKGNFDVMAVKTWFNDEAQFTKKTSFVDEHFKKVKKGDAILVVNLKKGKIGGYIGGGVLMEMGLAYYLKKKIFVLNKVPKDFMLYEEIMALHPVFLNNDFGSIEF